MNLKSTAPKLVFGVLFFISVYFFGALLGRTSTKRVQQALRMKLGFRVLFVSPFSLCSCSDRRKSEIGEVCGSDETLFVIHPQPVFIEFQAGLHRF